MADILISGTGIAGCTTAYWLSRAGHAVTMVERAPAPRTGGQAVDLRGAGRVVVERMGLMPTVRQVLLEQAGISWLDRRGRVTARMTSDAFGGEGVVSEIELLRGDLGRLQFEAVPGVDVRFDDTVTGLVQDEGGVEVTFERRGAQRFDLVIGADGFGSVVRRLAFGETGKDPLGCLIAWFTCPDPGDLDGWYEMHLDGRGGNGSLRPGRIPGEAKAALAVRVDRTSSMPATRDAQWALLRDHFADGGWRIPALLAAMETAPDFACAEVGQIRLPSWSRGRVAVLGDAGASPSPLTGLGTSVALVQAYVLAGELVAAPGDHRRAFARWEEVCRPYVTTAQELPPGGVAGFAPASGGALWLQQLSMRLATRWPMRLLLERQFAKAADVVLPSYEA